MILRAGRSGDMCRDNLTTWKAWKVEPEDGGEESSSIEEMRERLFPLAQLYIGSKRASRTLKGRKI